MIGEHSPDGLLLHLDAAVAEVFKLMLGMTCLPIHNEPQVGQETIIVIIRFSGGVTGKCLVYLGLSAARLAMQALLKESGNICESLVDDAVGELCNMIVGNWKDRIDPRLAPVLISTPLTLRYRDAVIPTKLSENLQRGYSFQGQDFGVILPCRNA